MAQRIWDLSAYKDVITALSEARENQKGGFESTRNWADGSTHFLGLAGELTVSLESGVPMDVELLIEGDGGTDFLVEGRRCDIKTSTYWEDPHLRLPPDVERRADIYILVSVNERLQSRVCGWATAAEMDEAELVDYGRGAIHSIREIELLERKQCGLPTFFPRRID
jgi:hypothetical protein|tara:strand:- start:2913 stop:3413 length:501 start_codon:yes stop_codon:yes gene_type:complete